MGRFLRLAQGVDVMPLALELHRAPCLWNQHTTRKTFSGTPHAAMDDIWVRFRPEHEITGLASHREEHRCAYWPAWRELPALRPLVKALKDRVDCVELGSILITRLPPGESILPHSDAGSWAPEWFNCKAHVTVAGSSLSRCEEEVATMREGEVWTFDNLLTHSVENPGLVDRIAVIVSMRCEA